MKPYRLKYCIPCIKEHEKNGNTDLSSATKNMEAMICAKHKRAGHKLPK